MQNRVQTLMDRISLNKAVAAPPEEKKRTRRKGVLQSHSRDGRVERLQAYQQGTGADMLKRNSAAAVQLLRTIDELNIKVERVDSAIRNLDKEIDGAMLAYRKEDSTKRREIKDQSYVLRQKKNEMTQTRLKTIGKEFGNVLVHASLSDKLEPEHVKHSFDAYCRFFAPNVFHFNALIGMYSRRNMLNEAEGLLRYMEDIIIKPDRFTYKKLIHGAFLAHDAHAAMRYIDEMKAKRIRMDQQIYDDLILVCQEENRTKALEFALESLALGHGMRHNAVTATIATALERGDKELWHQLEKKLLPRMDPESFDYLLAFYCKRGYAYHCFRVLKEMDKRSIKPDQQRLVTLQRAFILKRDEPSIRKIKSLMSRSSSAHGLRQSAPK